MNNISAAAFKRYNAKRQRVAAELVLAIAALFLAFAAGSALSWSQQDPKTSDRKLITRIEPQYPATLERLYIGGVVRLELVVAANGTVQGAKLIGGNPILGQSAIAAVKQWKYTPGRSETTTVVRLEFDPHH
jgi:TonB family protein